LTQIGSANLNASGVATFATTTLTAATHSLTAQYGGSATGTPTGSVSFTDGSITLGSVPLNSIQQFPTRVR
jgi:anti-sigma-K factor RskA